MEVRATSKIEGLEIKFPIYTKVVGVTHKNEDGTRRQDVLEYCSPGDELVLHRDRYNQYDENAIEVLTTDFETIGYIKSSLALKLAPLMDEGHEFYCEIEDVTGGDTGKKTLGCNIRVEPAKEAPNTETRVITIKPPQPVYEATIPGKRKGFLAIMGLILKTAILLASCFVILFVIIGFLVFLF